MILKIFNIAYLVAAFGWAAVATINGTQPALFWIEVFADPGETYSVRNVFGLTGLMLCIPILIINLVIFFINKKADADTAKNVSPDQPGVWITRNKKFQSSGVRIPIYINELNVGGISNGSTKFFPVSSETVKVRAGKGKNASEELVLDLKKEKQPRLETEAFPNGFAANYRLKEISSQ